jgi:hypothetical protein
MGTAPASIAPRYAIERSSEMDKDRIDGAAKTAGGKVKETVGRPAILILALGHDLMGAGFRDGRVSDSSSV